MNFKAMFMISILVFSGLGIINAKECTMNLHKGDFISTENVMSNGNIKNSHEYLVTVQRNLALTTGFVRYDKGFIYSNLFNYLDDIRIVRCTKNTTTNDHGTVTNHLEGNLIEDAPIKIEYDKRG